MDDLWDSKIGMMFTGETADAIRKAIADARTQALDDVKARMEDINENYRWSTRDRNHLYNRVLKEIEELKEKDDD